MWCTENCSPMCPCWFNLRWEASNLTGKDVFEAFPCLLLSLFLTIWEWSSFIVQNSALIYRRTQSKIGVNLFVYCLMSWGFECTFYIQNNQFVSGDGWVKFGPPCLQWPELLAPLKPFNVVSALGLARSNRNISSKYVVWVNTIS